MPPPTAILVVENHPAVLALMAEVLRRAGYAVTTADGGAEGLAAAQTAGWAVDLLVADVMLGGTTGPELATDLRRRIPGLPVLYVSTGCADDAVAEQVGHGEAHFLLKPFLIAQLVAKVKDILGLER